jgi:hypothetical protein
MKNFRTNHDWRTPPYTIRCSPARWLAFATCLISGMVLAAMASNVAMLGAGIILAAIGVEFSKGIRVVR